MGTDIHLFVERRASATDPWELLSVKSTCTWCDGSGKSPPHMNGEPCYGCKGTGQEAGYGSRNYSVFAMLANVRNGRGFAGVDIGSGFKPIAMPRGLPEDMSAELKSMIADDEGVEYGSERYEALQRQYGETYIGYHSFSWLSLRELLDYDWQQVTEHHGQCELRQYAAWKHSGSKYPDSWCGDCSGPRVYHVSEANADLLIKGIVLEPQFACVLPEHFHSQVPAAELKAWARGDRGVSIYAPMRVKDTYAESAGAFYSRFIPALVEATKDQWRRDDVRIVFGFDS